MIRFANVYKAYPNGALALKDVTFHVSKGEFVFLTGHSGAGKSTIMKLLFAEQKPSAGEVRVSGYNVIALKADEVPACAAGWAWCSRISACWKTGPPPRILPLPWR